MKPGRLIILFALMQFIVYSFVPITHEESMWHYIGRNWFRFGLTPYEGGVDNKSPLIFAVYGLSDILSGINVWFPRLLGTIVQSAGIYFLYKIALRLTAHQDAERSRQTGIITITIYGLSLLWRASGGKYVSFTETYAVTFLLIAVHYYLNASGQANKESSKKFLLGGVFAGIAFGWRISACFTIVALLLHALLKQKRAIVPFATGLVVTIVILGALAVVAGIDLKDIYTYAFAGNFGDGSTTDHSLGWKLDNFLMSFFYSEFLLFYPLLAGYFLLRQRTGLQSAAAALLLIWLLLEFIGINILGIYARPHFKHLLPVLSLMSALTIVQVMHAHTISIKHVLVAVWLLCFPKVTEPYYGLKRKLEVTSNLPELTILPDSPTLRPDEYGEIALGRWLRGHSAENDLLFVAGFGARVQLYAERRSPAIYFNVTQTSAAKKKMMQEIMISKPAIIAIPVFPEYALHVQEDIRRFIDNLAAIEYQMIEKNIYGYSVFRKK